MTPEPIKHNMIVADRWIRQLNKRISLLREITEGDRRYETSIFTLESVRDTLRLTLLESKFSLMFNLVVQK